MFRCAACCGGGGMFGEAMALSVEHLLRTAATLEQALLAIARTPAEDMVMFDLFRNAAIKSFELSLETAGKLIRKALRAYGGSPHSVDALVFNDVLRHAGKHGLLDEAGVGRWLAYRANRNSTAHDYGEGFANITLKLLPAHLLDVPALAAPLQAVFDAAA
jgi:nucleotidyltransferase substrate binding protein (TIGR01987 family)